MNQQNTCVRILTAVGLWLTAAAAAAATIELVPVNYPGNPHDATGYGSVGYAFQIGKFEISAGQYVEFLNAVAKTDTYGLYDGHMEIMPLGCKIRATGGAGNLTYSVASDWANRPVNYVSWGDAARFCNWLHNGQPTGAQGATTTEDGAYLLNGATDFVGLQVATRKTGAQYFLPTEDEWYKAAYHKNDGATGNYWLYPTATNSVPSNVLGSPTDPGNNATFYAGSYTIGDPYNRTAAGAHENSDSPYGTFDQGGNVREWNEGYYNVSYRGVRGGGFDTFASTLAASDRGGATPIEGQYNIGFRVAAVPEPSSFAALLAGAGAAAIVWRRKRARKAVQRRLLVALLLALSAAAAPAATIELVPVGNPGNGNDTTGYGGVGYAYQIGKFEVTAGQYTEFLNAVAKTDTYDLYSAAMASEMAQGCRIQQSGNSGNYSYAVASDWANRPVNFVNFWDAARFCNWLHNGQPTDLQGPGTTEDGAYLNIGNQATFARQPGAKYFLPTENEWYKAAYHKNDGVTSNYWLYPTATDSVPSNVLGNPTDPGNNATFESGGYTIGGPYNRTEVGAHENSESPYGTFDQAGNVWEWNETLSGSSRWNRGGGFLSSATDLAAASHVAWTPNSNGWDLGFRVAGSEAVPEPGSLVALLAGAGAAALIWQRKRTRKTARRLLLVALSLALPATAGPAATIELVPVGNPGNSNDATGYGGVGYAYQIGKFEVTAGQYTEFLTSVAASDPYNLYHSSMADTALGSGIARSGSSGSYSYAVASAFVNRPVNYVSWYDAARYSNWLTTGNTESGVYAFSGGTLGSIMDHPTAGATYGTAYLIPTENEWYKAAYHKNDGVTGAYFRYPTSSSTAPGRAMADPLPGNNANYFGSPYPIDSGKHTTVAGEFQNSASPYGTFDQGGNVLEWNETQNGSWRGLRGGSFLYGSADLASSSRSGDSPTYEDSFVGFRVAAVPEPGSLALLATVGLAGLVWRRKRARKVVRRRPAPPT